MFDTKLKLGVVNSNVKIKLNHETENIWVCSFLKISKVKFLKTGLLFAGEMRYS